MTCFKIINTGQRSFINKHELYDRNIELSDYRSLQNAVFLIVMYKFRNGDFRVVLVTHFPLICNVGQIAQIRSV